MCDDVLTCYRNVFLDYGFPDLKFVHEAWSLETIEPKTYDQEKLNVAKGRK